MLLPLAVAYWALLRPLPIVRVDPPRANGYEELMRAAAELARAAQPDFDTATDAEKEAYLKQQVTVLNSARKALARPCVRRLEYTDSDLKFENLAAIRNLARALAAEGGLAEMDGRYGDALAAYVDILRLGQATSAGGLVVDWLVGISVQGIGMDRLTRLRKQLDVAQCRDLLGRLEPNTFAFEPREDILHRDWAWEERVYGWQCRLIHLPERLGRRAGSPRMYDLTVDCREASHRLLVLGIAVECFRQEKGHPPEQLVDLVPHYLRDLPTDSFGDQSLHYRLQGVEYVLYSVGPDLNDDGGLRDWTQSGTFDGDILLDPPKQPAPSGVSE